MCASEDKAFSFKFETEDNSNFSSSYQQDEEQSDINQVGELIPIKTAEGGHTSVYLRTGNRLLFCSGKYFYIEHTIAQTDHQKEHTGIVCTCHTCGVKIKGSLKVSSNFICHLKNKHPEVYQEFLRQKADFSAPYVRSWKKINSHRVNPYLPPTPLLNNFIQNNEKQEQFQQSVLRFLLATNQTFDVVEKPSFLKLFEFSEVPRQMHAAEYYEKLVAEACEYKKLELCQTFNDGSVFVCNTIDTWTYNSSKFLAISSHWIDEHFQRQSAFVACRRLSMEEDCEEVQNKVFAHFGFVSTTITACPTHNIHNMTEDFIIFGLSKEVLAERGKNLQEEMIYQLNFLPISNKNAMQLEILKLHKIWVRNFVSKLNNDMKLVHRTVIEKCCHIWSSWHCKDFKEFFNSLFGEPLSKPQIFSSTSIYTAIKQLVANKNKLEQLCRLINKPCFSLEEIGYLEELLDVFEPLNAVFVFLDLPQNHYYGCFLPSLVTLKWKLTRLYNSKKLFRLQDTLKLLKEEILHEFKDYYDLSESKSEAVIAALTYPPVKTRFLMGLKDNINCLSFQPRTVLLKYGKDYHQHHEDQPNSNNKMFVCQGQMSMEHSANGSDFFDFGDTTETVDAEELRDVNISKKEIAELMTELLSNLNEGISFESIELETPRKFLLSCQDEDLNTPNTSFDKPHDNPDVSRQLTFEQETHHESLNQPCSAIISSANVTQQNFSFHPDVMSTPSSSQNNQQNEANVENAEPMTIIPVATPTSNDTFTSCGTVAIPASNINNQVELIAVPIPGQPNCFQLAKVVASGDDALETSPIKPVDKPTAPNNPKAKVFATRYTVPYETNYCGEYISVKRHIIAEYKEKFESLKHAQVNQVSSTTTDSELSKSHEICQGFTKYQYDLLQQQLRIHVQTLTQTYIQTYCHPELWRLAKKPKEMLMELQEKSKSNHNFKIWNLEKAIALINKWQQELDEDTEENKELMKYLNREVELTNHNTRQIPRFHPRILDCFLESNVFMYPEYLPRMPFSSKVASYEAFSPVESYLIAMGLEKHVRIITEKKERIPSKTTPLRMACRRLTKDTLSGKQHRRVWAHLMHLKTVDYYNPIKYYFQHNRAPPVERTTIIGFADNCVLPPKERFHELPLVFQTYLQKKNAPPQPKKTNNRIVTNPRIKASDAFRDSYLEFVREAVGEDLTFPAENCFTEITEQDDTSSTVLSTNSSEPLISARKRKASRGKLPKPKRRPPRSVTINVNYVFGGSANNILNVSSSSVSANTSYNHSATLLTNETENADSTLNETANTSVGILSPSINNSNNNQTPVVTYNFDLTTKTLQCVPLTPVTSLNQNTHLPTSANTVNVVDSVENSPQLATRAENVVSSSPEATFTFPVERVPTTQIVATNSAETIQRNDGLVESVTCSTQAIPISAVESAESTPQLDANYAVEILQEPEQTICCASTPQEDSIWPTATVNEITYSQSQRANTNNNSHGNSNTRRKIHRVAKINTPILLNITKLNKNISKKALAYREKRKVKQRCEDLIIAYGLYLETLQVHYKHSPLVQHFYRRFKALELYTNLLKSLKMMCNKNNASSSSPNTNSSSPGGLKRSRNAHGDDESSPSSQRMARKINRQEENFRHMLLPDNPDETNRKDAIYAFNFYEKVEEAFRSSNRPDDCKKFNSILKTFDPKKDKVSDLYHKLEALFLPDHPELAQVFLTFLLPSEAAEIGKFFEHFMITNMTTFINKLNIYFNKQPAQIRKIYNCLNELAEDPDVTMKKIEARIVPLLKGNQFLIDWFMQQFPKSTPPERLFSTPEHVLNVKEQQSNRTSEHVETITDVIDSPTHEVPSQPTCQLRYINGRIFYGSKMLLPAKLSFMAASFKDNRSNSQISLPPKQQTTSGCVHAIREHGEKCLQSTTDMTSVTTTHTETSDDQDKSEEEDVSKVLVIDTTAEEDDSCSSIELCDENTLKAHALRLNPSYYGSTCYSANATSTPNLNSSFQGHHPIAKKVSLNFNDESGGGAATGAGKTSPRKNSNQNQHSTNSASNSNCQLLQNVREKRKSPSKKTKSPLNNTTGRSVRSYNQPMVVIHENSTAIQCAKRLKSLVESSSDEHMPEEAPDSKEHVHIVAKTKQNSKTSTTTSAQQAECVKQENSDDLEFLPESASITRSPFPALKMDTDSEDAATTSKTPSRVDSDEDCKIDIVANLVTNPVKSSDSTAARLPLNSAWTREEDKAILIEMKIGSSNREELYIRIAEKLPQRTICEIKARHQFLMDFLSKLQGK